MWRVAAPLVTIVLAQAALTAGSLQVMSAVRAYVAADNLWYRGQKDAVHDLQVYVGTGAHDYLRKFDAAIAIPVADRTARLALETSRGEEAARQGFRQGGIDDDDIGGLIWLFRYFRGMPQVAGAIEAWRATDVLIDRLIAIRNEAEADAALHDPSAATIKRWVDRIDPVDAALSSHAVDFAEHLGRASRQVSWLLLLVNAAFALGLAGVVLLHTRRMLQQRRLAETELAEEKERAQLTLASIGDAVVVASGDDLISYMNPAAQRLIAEGKEATGQPVSSLFRLVEQPVNGSCRPTDAAASAPQQTLVRADGSTVPISLVETPISRGKESAGRVMIIHDMTAERRLVEELAWAASHDALTGLANRRQFEFDLQQLISTPTDGTAHLLLLDLDQFKIVNDTCGHVAGDRVLRQVAELLANEIGPDGLVARIGGDEFGILLHDVDEARESAADVAERIRETVDQSTFVHDGNCFRISASIGAVRLDDCAGVEDALRLADVACFLAKDKGRNRVQLHRSSDADAAVRVAEMSWVHRIRNGLDEDRFCLYEQEIRPISAAGERNRRCELLLRLRDENGNLVPPGSFLPAAERYGLMPMIDRWVVRRAFETIAARRRSSSGNTSYAINLSGVALGDAEFVDFVAYLLAWHDIPPQSVCFEITETSAISNLAETRKFIERMRRMGCRFSLDDFGTGMSSIAYLKHLPVDFIKIDGSFVREILNSKVDRAMVEMITKTAKIMQKRVIAEFVETPEILEELRVIGVDYAQGYAIGRPVPFIAPERPTALEQQIA